MVILLIILLIRIKPIYITGFGGAYKIEIPLKIRLTRNCDQYAEFVKSKLGPMFLPNPRLCPWVKVDLSKDAEFTIKGTKFKIPRDYLLLGDSRAPNGEVSDILMEMEYPSMLPPNYNREDLKTPDENGIRPKDYFVMVHVKYNGKKDHEAEEKRLYLGWSGFGFCLEDPIKGKMHCPENKIYYPELNLTQYSNGKDAFIKGDDVFNPDYWLICDYFPDIPRNKNMNPGCERTEFLTSNKPITFNYTFRKKSLLRNHNKVREKVLAKLNEFINN